MIGHLEFFSTQSLMSSPGTWVRLFDSLPRAQDVGALCRIVQGLMVHVFWAERYGVSVEAARRGELQMRAVCRKLERIAELDSRPLIEARQLKHRLVGNCRDFSLMLTSMLRHGGFAARARCGFATYFLPDHYEDHWVCEYWSSERGRWLLADPQLDDFQRDKLGITFDPLDVPRDRFIVGGRAWQMCRRGEADPDRFGIHDLKGLWFVRGDLVRDVAALNKMELLPWDAWGLIEPPDEQIAADDLVLLDHVAELTRGEVTTFEMVQLLYENDNRLHVPGKIRSHGPQGATTVDLAEL